MENDAKDVTSGTEKKNEKAAENAAESASGSANSTDDVKKTTDSAESPVKEPGFFELLRTKDHASRKILIISMVSGILALLLSIATVAIIISKRGHKTGDEGLEKETKLKPVFKADLGEFRFFIKSDQKGEEDGDMRLDIVLESESEATTKAILEKLPEVRDAIFPLLMNLTRQDLLVPKSRDQVRKNIVDRMSTLSLPDKVTQAYIVNMIVE